MARIIEGEWDYIVVRRRHGRLPAWRTGCRQTRRTGFCCWRPAAKDDWIWFHIPVGYLFAINNPRADWMFKTEAEPGLNGRVADLSARQGHRRLLGHQRHDHHARPERRTTTTGGSSASPAGAGTT